MVQPERVNLHGAVRGQQSVKVNARCAVASAVIMQGVAIAEQSVDDNGHIQCDPQVRRVTCCC